jgi:hypothetical protein
MANSIAEIVIPDSNLARKATELVRETESTLLFNHSTRVFLWGALAGARKKLKFDPELLYIGAMFHDMGLTPKYSSQTERFEVDGANAARDFLRSHHISEESIDIVWDAISLHTTPGIPKHKKPEVALVTVGVDTDVLGRGYDELSDQQRQAVLSAYPRGKGFKEGIINAFFDGFKHKPDSTFGTMNDDVIARMDNKFRREDFCEIILNSSWEE